MADIPRGIVAAASLGFAVIQLDVFVVNVGVKPIGSELGGGTAALQWVVGAYTLMFAALILTSGALADRFGARRTYGIGFVVFVVASVACGLAPTMGALIAARAVQGLGAALLGSGSLSVLNHSIRDERARTRALAVWAMGAAVALSAGPIVGGALIAAVGWRSIFFINVPIGALGLALTRRYVDETPRAERRLDVRGQLAAVAAMGALAAGLIEGGVIGFADPFIVAAFVVAALAIAVFVTLERHAGEPMLPLPLFRRGRFSAPAALGLLINVAFYGLIFVFSLYFQRVQGYSPLRAGLAFVPMTAVVLVANLLSGRLADRLGAANVIRGGLLLMAVGCIGLLLMQPDTPFAELVGQQLLLGFGIGLVVPPMTSAMLGSVERSRSGIASGTLNTARQAGSVVGVALFGTLIASGSFATGAHVALLISVALVAVAALLTRPMGAARR
jgi:DHA2 family methylenomycin A resistance protein-like MFS transporter